MNNAWESGVLLCVLSEGKGKLQKYGESCQCDGEKLRD